MTTVVTANHVSQSLEQNPADKPSIVSRSIIPDRTQWIGQVESVMTRHTVEGDDYFVLLVLADGSLFRGRWRATPDKLLPRSGDVLRIESESNDVDTLDNNPLPVNAANQLAGNACYLIKNWHVIPVPYPLDVLDRLYNSTEQPEDLDRLWGIIQRIPIASLQIWLSDLFANSQFSVPFVQVPASHNHHHSHAGGLLSHSVECAEWVERVATETLNAKESALAIVAALLHDFGKIETMNHAGFSQMVPHEVLSLTLLEPALATLQSQWLQGAHALRQLLSWSTCSEKFPKLPGALLVKMADQYSTALSAREKAFQAMPAHYYWASLKTPYSVQSFNRIN